MQRSLIVIKYLPIVVLLVLLSHTAAADEQPHYDRVNLAVDVEDEVDNDMLVAVLYVQREGSELATLSDEVNKTIRQAITRSKNVSDINLQTLAYQTHPNYQKQRLIGWRVRQSLQLKSRNIDALSKLLGDLQSILAVESISYHISPARRSEVEERLIGEAITAFQQRAQNITQHLKHNKYRLVNMDITTNDSPVRPIRYRSPSTLMESKVAQPSIEPGTQKVTVTINAIIELVVN